MQNAQQTRKNASLSLNSILMEPEIKLTHIQSNHYFILINKRYKQAISYRSSNKYPQQHAIVAQADQNDINQIFQIQQIQDDKFEIVHGISTLVLTIEEQEVMLNFGKWKNNQFFYPQKINTTNDKLQYWIKTGKNSDKYLYYDGFALRCGQRSPQDENSIWQIRLCLHNKQLNKSCWIQYAFSNQVIDIPEATNRSDVSLIQYPCNYRFNQRFYIQLVEANLYMIQNIKTQQYLTISESPFSTSIVQQPVNPKKAQLKQVWKIQYVGNGLYSIRSAIKDDMYLVVKDRSTKISQVLGISDNQNWSLWKIVGNFNVLPNKDFNY